MKIGKVCEIATKDSETANKKGEIATKIVRKGRKRIPIGALLDTHLIGIVR